MTLRGVRQPRHGVEQGGPRVGESLRLTKGDGQVAKHTKHRTRTVAKTTRACVRQRQAGKAWFDDVSVIGKLRTADALAALSELGDAGAVARLEGRLMGKRTDRLETPLSLLHWGRPEPWEHTAHAFGYIPLATAGAPDDIEILHAGRTDPDLTLRNSKIDVTVDFIRVAGYPGGGIHHILFDFYAQNQVPGQVEHVHFNQMFRAREGESVGVLGYPVFLGLNVSNTGVAFKCFTVNVKNDDDEAFLAFLDGDVFKAGLQLASTAQPAIAPLAGIAIGITKGIAARNRNKAVQDFFMGLDFTQVATRARLREGSFVAVQIPEESAVIWDWAEWIFNRRNGRIVKRQDRNQMIPFNYIIFSVSRHGA